MIVHNSENLYSDVISKVVQQKLEKAMATHSSTLAWKIPWTEEPNWLQSMGSRKIGHDWATSLSRFTFMYWRRKWQPTPVFLPGESRGRGSLVGCRLWGTQSRTRRERRSSSSSSSSQQKQDQPWGIGPGCRVERAPFFWPQAEFIAHSLEICFYFAHGMCSVPSSK